MSMESGRENAQYLKMTETPVARLVVTLGIPTTISMLVSAIYNMADTAFVGTLGTSASGAIGVVFGYMAILQAIGFMFGQGSGSQIARLLGQRDRESANRIASTGFFTAFGLGLLVSVLSWFFLDPLLRLLGSSETILPHARAYCRFILLGAPFIIGSFVLNNILRFEGLAIKAMVGLVTGAVLNLIFDPLLIIVFHLGTAGAGLATAFSQFVSFCILLSMFLRGVTQSRLSIRYYTHDFRVVLRIIAIGLPSLLRQAMSRLNSEANQIRLKADIDVTRLEAAGKSVEALKAREKALNAELEVQQKKLELLNRAYQANASFWPPLSSSAFSGMIRRSSPSVCAPCAMPASRSACCPSRC